MNTFNFSTMSDSEIQNLISDLRYEMTKRESEKVKEAMDKFFEAFNNLIEMGVKLTYTYEEDDGKLNTITLDNTNGDFDFEY